MAEIGWKVSVGFAHDKSRSVYTCRTVTREGTVLEMRDVTSVHHGWANLDVVKEVPNTYLINLNETLSVLIQEEADG